MQGTSAVSDFLQIGGGFAVLFVLAVLVVNAVLWLFLPWVMLNKMNKMIERLRYIETAAESIARNTRPSDPGPAFNAASLPPIPGKELYFVSDGEKPVGPHSLETLRGLLGRGVINANTPVFRQGDAAWKTLDAVIQS